VTRALGRRSGGLCVAMRGTKRWSGGERGVAKGKSLASSSQRIRASGGWPDGGTWAAETMGDDSWAGTRHCRASSVGAAWSDCYWPGARALKIFGQLGRARLALGLTVEVGQPV
jgi:hypothetical protein